MQPRHVLVAADVEHPSLACSVQKSAFLIPTIAGACCNLGVRTFCCKCPPSIPRYIRPELGRLSSNNVATPVFALVAVVVVTTPCSA